MCIAIGTSLLHYVDMYGILKLVLELPADTHSVFQFRMESRPYALTWLHTGDMQMLGTLSGMHTHAHIYVKYNMYDIIPVLYI